MEIGWVLCNKCNRRPADVPGILSQVLASELYEKKKDNACKKKNKKP